MKDETLKNNIKSKKKERQPEPYLKNTNPEIRRLPPKMFLEKKLRLASFTNNLHFINKDKND